jgi:AmmeMemoRadiSam system protein B
VSRALVRRSAANRLNLEDLHHMKRHFSITFICVHFFLPALWLIPNQAAGEETTLNDLRPSILAGTWYPGTPGALAKTIQGYLSEVKTPGPAGTLKAIIVPHAGYRYSGPIAAHAYKLLRDLRFQRVILVGPSHRVPFEGVSVNLQAGYQTPLGIVPVDQETAKKILHAGPHIQWLRDVHSQEHSLEIQLPFLQTVLQDFKIVPIIMGRQDFETCSNLANTLVQVLGDGKGTLLLASSDLSHYHAYNQARALDLQFIKDVESFDPQALTRDLSVGKCEACGGGPVATILLAAKAMGANRAVILNHANSGDVTGDHSRVVGYLAAALVRTSDTDPHPR